eukprot:1975892-Alexandrium_andersonii.AAC.1
MGRTCASGLVCFARAPAHVSAPAFGLRSVWPHAAGPWPRRLSRATARAAPACLGWPRSRPLQAHFR